jgi:transposase
MPPAKPDLVLNGRVTDAGWGHIHALCEHSDASISFVAESLGIARSSVREQLANPNPPSKRPARRPPAVPARNKLAIKERRRLVRKYTNLKIKRKCVRQLKTKQHISYVTVHEHPSPASVARKLAVTHGIKASRATIRRDHRVMGYRSYKAAFRPRLQDDDHEKRMKFCYKNLRTSAKKILFSDEKWFNTNWTGSRHYTDKKGPNRVQEVVPKQQGAPTCYFWGIIGVGVKTLVHLKKQKKLTYDDEEKKFSVTGAVYKRKCLIPHMYLMQEKGKIFMQDGAKIHWSKDNVRYLANKGVRVMQNWPPRSPDMNPIEQLWAIISAKVARRCPWSEEAVAAFVIEEWDAYPQADVDKLCLSFTKRLHSVIAKKGAHGSG